MLKQTDHMREIINQSKISKEKDNRSQFSKEMCLNWQWCVWEMILLLLQV